MKIYFPVICIFLLAVACSSPATEQVNSITEEWPDTWHKREISVPADSSAYLRDFDLFKFTGRQRLTALEYPCVRVNYSSGLISSLQLFYDKDSLSNIFLQFDKGLQCYFAEDSMDYKNDEYTRIIFLKDRVLVFDVEYWPVAEENAYIMACSEFRKNRFTFFDSPQFNLKRKGMNSDYLLLFDKTICALPNGIYAQHKFTESEDSIVIATTERETNGSKKTEQITYCKKEFSLFWWFCDRANLPPAFRYKPSE